MLLVPEADPAKSWQRQAAADRPDHFDLMGNVLLYATDKLQGLRVKGEWVFPRPDPSVAAKMSVKAARLKFAGNWDPEPAGWRRLAAALHNDKALDLSVDAVDPADGIDRSFKLASLTGTGPLALTPAARDAIRAFVDGGGTLVVDAAGGDAEFAAAAEKELAAIFPDDPLQDLPAAVDEAPAAYRTFARKKIVGELNAPRLRGIVRDGRTAVYYSALDLSAGLVGNAVDGILGYDPATATAIVGRIVAAAAAEGPHTRPMTRPASRPTSRGAE